ncbi:MAG: hypothetical protein HQK88_01925 [Nitrospirae bacterium]|nr:hypothetical protein [Nitrospirota bacterium]MBF0533736.1 hypothetical protein [Nitrospirota bacterium]MBF0615555.1 hypothetical protein [Nitrospirota bacterium]
MKKRFIYFLALLLVITAVAANEGSKGVMAADNVSYIMPFLHTHTNNVVYCVASNMSSDNATIYVTVLASGTASTVIPSWTSVNLSGSTLYARSTTMLTFSGTSAIAGSAITDLSSSVSSGSNAFGALITFAGANTQASTTGVWYGVPTSSLAYEAGNRNLGIYQAGLKSGLSQLPRYTYGQQARLSGNTYIDVNGGQPTVPLTCQTLTLACFQGTTSPKRNLVGYMCMDTINSMYPAETF